MDIILVIIGLIISIVGVYYARKQFLLQKEQKTEKSDHPIVEMKSPAITTASKRGAELHLDGHSESETSTSVHAFRAPIVTGFWGRDQELRELDLMFENRKVLFIEGIAGMGKTYFVSKFAEKIENEYRIFWFDCKTEGLSAESVMIHMNEGFKKEGNYSLNGILTDTNIPPQVKIRLFAEEMDKIKTTFFFDDFHDLKNDTVEKLILTLINFSRNCKILIISRTITDFMKDLDVGTASHFILEGFSKQDFQMHSKNFGISSDKNVLQKVYEKTGGIPLAINLFRIICRYDTLERVLSMPIYVQQQINEKFFQRVLVNIPSEEKELLINFSVFNDPVEREGFYCLQPEQLNGLDTLINHLIDRFLINKNQFHLFDMHPLLRELCYSILENKQEYHLKAAQYYENKLFNLKNSKDNITLERLYEVYLKLVYHYHCSSNNEKLLEALLNAGEYGKEIHANEDSIKHFQLVLELLPKLESKFQVRKLDTLVNLGILYEKLGQPEMSIQYFQEALQDLRNLNNDLEHREIDIRLKLAKVLANKGEYTEALKQYKSVEQLLSNQELQKAHLELHLGLYNLYTDITSFEIAKKELNICKEYAIKLSDKRSLAYISAKFDIVSWQRCRYSGQINQSILYYNQLMELVEAENDKNEVSHALLMIGLLHYLKGDYETAIDYQKKSIEIDQKIGNRMHLALGTSNLGGYYFENGQNKEALKWLEKGRNECEKIQLRYMISENYRLLAEYYAVHTDFEKACHFCIESLKISRRLKIQTDTMVAYRIIGMVYREQEKWEKAEKYFLKALEGLRRSEFYYELGKAYYEFASFYSTRGRKLNDENDIMSAQKYFKLAIDIFSEGIGGEKWLTIAAKAYSEISHFQR